MVDWQNAVWIWRQGGAGKDEYVDFLCTFDADEIENWQLYISADSDYNVYINGRLTAFGQYSDYPARKVYDAVDISRYVGAGANRMIIRVWYYGVDSQTYMRGEAGLIFSLRQCERVVCESSKAVLSRRSKDYISGNCQSITSQLGLTFCYNVNGDDGYLLNCDVGFEPSAEMPQRPKPELVRPILGLSTGKRTCMSIVGMGAYCLCGGENAAQRMQLSRLFPGEVDVADGRAALRCKRDGIYIVVDLGRETVGFLTLEVTVPNTAHIDIGYGEHLRGGVCPVVIGTRCFCAEYIASPGHNSFMNAYRRFGGRYLQIFVPSEWVELDYLGITPTLYPVNEPLRRPADPLRRRIYDVCVDTLRLCMHEHYEDCPWREQALYTMDSRNQMLCGYYAFGEYRFARASLWLISQGVREDGLLSLCYPAGLDYPIPSFSLIYFVQMREYIDYSGDTTLAKQCYPVLESLMRTFLTRRVASGLVSNFEGLWNFYEWSHGMSGGRGTDKNTDAPLNAMLVLALESLSKICEYLNMPGNEWREAASELRAAIGKQFYDESVGLFRTSANADSFSVLTNALCLLCGAAGEHDVRHILKIIVNNDGEIFRNVMYESENHVSVVPTTLSMNCFRYDALLSVDRQKYGTIILGELDRVYGFMLEQGATSFWETIKGRVDFHGAGSLCHGWSALPIYYYSILDSSMTLSRHHDNTRR